MDKNTKQVFIALLIIGGLFVSIEAATYTPIIYVGGWEVHTDLERVTVNANTFTADNLPPYNYSSWGAAYVKFDADSELIGTPTLSVQLSSPIEYVNVDGEWQEARDGEYFKRLVKDIGDQTYFFYQHVFFFELRVIAEADYFNYYGLINGEAKDMRQQIKPEVTVGFAIMPDLWRVKTTVMSDDGLATYAKADVWTGVMSTAVDESSGGYVAALPDGFAGVNGIWSVTNVGRLNMFSMSSSETYRDTSIDQLDVSPSVIEGVPSAIIAEIAGTVLVPGWWLPPMGTIGTYAVQAEYRVRFDIVTSALYTFQQGDQESELDNATVEEKAGEGGLGQVGDFFDQLREIFSDPLTGIAALIVLALVLFAVVKLVPVFLRLTPLGRGD